MERDDLAAGFFLLAHDEFSGKPRIGPDRLGCGLVAAELAQLLLTGRIAIADARVVLTDVDPTEPLDVHAYVLETIRRDMSVQTVRYWVQALAGPLYELVARALQQRGVVHREDGGGLLRRRPDRFPGADLLAATRPRTRLHRMLRNPRELDLPGAFTAALVWTLGAEGALDPELDRGHAREVVRQINEHLPAGLHSVLAGARAALSGD